MTFILSIIRREMFGGAKTEKQERNVENAAVPSIHPNTIAKIMRLLVRRLFPVRNDSGQSPRWFSRFQLSTFDCRRHLGTRLLKVGLVLIYQAGASSRI